MWVIKLSIIVMFSFYSVYRRHVKGGGINRTRPALNFNATKLGLAVIDTSIISCYCLSMNNGRSFNYKAEQGDWLVTHSVALNNDNNTPLYHPYTFVENRARVGRVGRFLFKSLIAVQICFYSVQKPKHLTLSFFIRQFLWLVNPSKIHYFDWSIHQNPLFWLVYTNKYKHNGRRFWEVSHQIHSRASMSYINKHVAT